MCNEAFLRPQAGANTYTIPNGFREVTREEFFRTVGKENVTPTPCGRYPYYNEWRTPDGYVRGWSHAGTYAVRQDPTESDDPSKS